MLTPPPLQLFSFGSNRVRYMPRAHGSQSSETSIDSDIEEDVGSDVDNSRVLAPHEIKSHIPESSTPRKANAPGDSQSYPPDSLHTQATQQVNPLTPSQLRALMGDDEEEDGEDADETRDEIVNGSIIPEGNSEHILSTSEGELDADEYSKDPHRNYSQSYAHSRGGNTARGAHGGANPVTGSTYNSGPHKNTPMSANMALSLIEGVASRTSSHRGDLHSTKSSNDAQDNEQHVGGVPPEAHTVEADTVEAHHETPRVAQSRDGNQPVRSDHTMHAVAALQHMHNNEPINSSPDNWTPAPQRFSRSSDPRDALRGRLGMSSGSAEVIEETPMKLLSMPSTTQSPFVFILVKWTGSPHWWPARCNRVDWQEKRPKTRVLFRKNEYGDIDLRLNPVIYQLQPDDMVHVITKPAKQRFRVVACGVTTLPEGSIWTNDGFNQIRIQNANNKEDEFSVDAEDIYLTKNDMQLWRARQESSGVPSDKLTAGDLTPGGRGLPQNFTTPMHLNDSSRHGEVNTPGSGLHNTTHNTTANATIPSASSKPPPVSLNLPGEISAGGLSGGREPLDTPTNNGTKRRSAGRGDNSNLTTTNSPRKRRVRSVDYGDDNSSYESSPGSSPDPQEDYNLKSSPIVSPVRRSRNRHSRHFKEPVEGPDWRETQELSFNGRFNKHLFKNCIFSISTHETQSVKMRAREILVGHGAKVLDEGLSELVSLTDISEEDSSSVPDLECDFGNATFAAVLADQPRRTSKYLEMVALGWPCLSITYMHDCVEQNRMLDWRPYLLPAGKSNLLGKKMSVSLDTSAFYQKWIREVPLNQQFNTRRVIFRCSVPLCIVTTQDTSKSSLVLLASFCASRFKLWFYSSKRDVPEGGILLDLKPTTNTSKEIKRTDAGLLDQLQNYAAADSTVVKNTEWMIQCIINGGLV